MILADTTKHWSTLINIILNSYFSQLTTICVLQHKDYDIYWPNTVNFNVYLRINPLTLNESFARDVFNYTNQDMHFMSVELCYDDWIKKLMVSIEKTFCEGFLVFQDDIPKFASAFRAASVYSKWRSIYNRFLFIYTTDVQHEEYFVDLFFKSSSSFNPPIDLFPSEKLQDLQGREIIVGAFDYRPFIAVDFQRLPQYYDYAEDNPTHLCHVDGAEMHIVHTFCALYNCTVQVDTSEKSEWGMVFPNNSGDGLIRMVLDGKTHMAMGGMYSWDLTYQVMDQTTFLGRSGITCLVPAPRTITSWTLPLRPFQFNLWLGVIICLCLEIVSLLIARQFEQNLLEQTLQASWWSSIQFGYITTLKLFVSQGSESVVNSHTVKMMLFTCYMIDIIITSIYSGGLASILTIPTLNEVADSLERLYKHNLTWTGSSIDWVVAITPHDNVESDPITERLLSNFLIYTTEEAREKAQSENMGFAVERMSFGHFGNADFLTSVSLNRLKLMVDDIYYQFTVAIVPRLWPHLPKYNDLILLWHSSGFDKFWEWKIAADYMNVNEQNQVEVSQYTNYDVGPVKLDMKNFAGLWLLWMIGICASIMAFVGEWILYWCVKKFKKDTPEELQLDI